VGDAAEENVDISFRVLAATFGVVRSWNLVLLLQKLRNMPAVGDTRREVLLG
jgi:hypothetical protein